MDWITGMKKGGRWPPPDTDGCAVLPGSSQTEDFPVLHAAAIPFDLVWRIAELQQVTDVVR